MIYSQLMSAVTAGYKNYIHSSSIGVCLANDLGRGERVLTYVLSRSCKGKFKGRYHASGEKSVGKCKSK